MTLPVPWLQIIEGFICLSAAVIGGLLLGFVVRRVSMLVWHDLSRVAVFRFRLLGGLAGALLAYLFLGAPGFGPGLGGWPGMGQTAREETATDTAVSLKIDPSPRDSTPRPGVLRILLLGEKTDPPYQSKNRFFAVGNSNLKEAIDVEGVMKKVTEMKRDGNLKEIELVVFPQSTSLQNLEVQRLRRAIQEAGLRFYAPDPENPFGPGRKP